MAKAMPMRVIKLQQKVQAVGIMEEVQNEGEAIDGGTLKVALVTDAPFQGIFSFSLSSDAYDTRLMQFSHE